MYTHLSGQRIQCKFYAEYSFSFCSAQKEFLQKKEEKKVKQREETEEETEQEPEET